MKKSITHNEIKQIINEYIQTLTDECERDRIMKPRSLSDIRGKEGDCETCMDLLDNAYIRSDITIVKDGANDILNKHGISLDEDSYEFRLFCRELIKAEYQWHFTERVKNGQSLSDITEVNVNSTATATVEPEAGKDSPQLEPSQDNGPTISEVIKQFLAEGDKSNRWAEKARVNVAYLLSMLVRVLGVIPMKNVDRTAMNRYKQTIMKPSTAY